MKRLFLNILFSMSSLALVAQVYQYPMNKMARVNGREVMFAFTPTATPYEIPLSSREFLERSFMHKEICLPPYKSHPTSFLAVEGIDRLDSVLITTGNKVEKILFLSDSMSVLQGQQFYDAEGKLTAEVALKYLNDKETERTITVSNGDNVVYKLGHNGPVSMEAKTQFGKESLTWVYKNSMPSMASQSGGRGRENAIFTYTPFKKLSSIKWKSGRGTIETTFEYSDYEASVMNPICLVKDEKLSSKMAWDVYNVEANKNQALVRVNNLQEKKIYEINGDSRDLISSYLLTFKPFANMKGGSKNMLSHVSYEGLSESYQESYDYTGDLKISKVVKSDMVVEYEYNGLGNIAKVIITPAIGDKSEIVFYYTNIEEERQRIAEEKAKAEAERIAREEEEKRLKEEEEAAAKAAEAEKRFEESQSSSDSEKSDSATPSDSDKKND